MAASEAAAAAEAAAESAGSDSVTPFSLDPDFDYESIAQTERFSVARERSAAPAEFARFQCKSSCCIARKWKFPAPVLTFSQR